MVPIILDEWLIEIGFINYDYGHGVAEWSLSIIPHKFAILALAGALIGLNVALLLGQRSVRDVVAAVRSGGPVRDADQHRRALRRRDQRHRVLGGALRDADRGSASLAVLGFDSFDVFRDSSRSAR